MSTFLPFRDPKYCERPGPPPEPQDVADVREAAEEMAREYASMTCDAIGPWEHMVEHVMRWAHASAERERWVIRLGAPFPPLK